MNSFQSNRGEQDRDRDQNDDLDWMKAEMRISDAMDMYGNIPIHSSQAKRRSKLYEFKGRLERGERTRALYNEIIEYTGG